MGGGECDTVDCQSVVTPMDQPRCRPRMAFASVNEALIQWLMAQPRRQIAPDALERNNTL